MEHEARRLAATPIKEAQERRYGIKFESSPTIILRAEMLLCSVLNPKTDRLENMGCLSCFINDKGYRLPGEHGTLDPFFFTVKDKLYLAYNKLWVTLDTLVYDLSGEAPRWGFRQ